jgi:predicted signal transduction protein with EAL and GGDEF domain
MRNYTGSHARDGMAAAHFAPDSVCLAAETTGIDNVTLAVMIGLATVATRLAGCVRKEDTVARTGGDEFVAVLNGIGKAEDAGVIGHKIVDELSRPFHVGRHGLDISCSVGISLYPRDGKDLNTLLANADAAMCHAKKTGRSKYQFFVPGMMHSIAR